MQHEIQLEQGPIRYRDTGQGEAIVFVHGLLADGRLWDGVVDRLGPGVRCIVPDWPLGSHAVPMAPAADLSPRGVAAIIAAFLDALDLEGVTLVGNDTGGAICQLVATEHPQRLGRLVLTDCDAFDNFLPPMFRYLQVAARIPGATTILTQSMRMRVARRLPIAYGWIVKHKLDPDLTKDWVKPVLSQRGIRRDVRKLLRGISKRDTLAAAEKLARFDKPTLIAWAPEDRAMPFEHAERLAAILPDARLERVDDAWTFVSLDQPARVAELIQAFVVPVNQSDGSVPAGAVPVGEGT
jgi:pimeloyl-ACP methyl ester carboxylesterase